MSLWELRFKKTLLFPNVNLNDILEMQFQLGYAMHIAPFFDNIDFFEFVWLYERMAEQRKTENEDLQKQNNGTSITDMMAHG